MQAAKVTQKLRLVRVIATCRIPARRLRVMQTKRPLATQGQAYGKGSTLWKRQQSPKTIQVRPMMRTARKLPRRTKVQGKRSGRRAANRAN